MSEPVCELVSELVACPANPPGTSVTLPIEVFPVDTIQPWEPRFLTLPHHRLVEHQLELALRDVESTYICGPKGVGKTETIRHHVARHETRRLADQMAGREAAPEILYYESSRAAGPKTVLSDLHQHLSKRLLSKRARQDWTPTMYIAQIALSAAEQGVGAIVIDEAHMIDPSNLDLLRQVPDAARRLKHPLRLILVGNEPLMQHLAQIGEDGERFTGKVLFPPLSPEDVLPYLPQFHPALAKLEVETPAKEWRALMREVFTAVRGSFRRLVAIIRNALELARVQQRELTATDLRQAITKIA